MLSNVADVISFLNARLIFKKNTHVLQSKIISFTVQLRSRKNRKKTKTKTKTKNYSNHTKDVKLCCWCNFVFKCTFYFWGEDACLKKNNYFPWLKKIIWVIGVLRRTVFGDWSFDNLCRSPHRFSKRQSPKAVLLRTSITQMIFFNQGMLLLGSNYFLNNYLVYRSVEFQEKQKKKEKKQKMT